MKVLDADDQLTPGQLAREVAVFRRHPEVGWLTAAALDLLPDGRCVAPQEDGPEGAIPIGGDRVYKAREEGREPRLGGIAEQIAGELELLTGHETRALVLGHLQRGGQPTPTDRILATRFGAAAVRAIENGEKNVMVAIQSNRIVTVPLREAIINRKQVPLDSDVIISAREIGVSFGDEEQG